VTKRSESSVKIYVVYDPDTGEIVHTHAAYVLGNDEPVAASEADVLALAPERERATRSLRVAPAPSDFDVRSRLQVLQVNRESGEVHVVQRDRPGPERGTQEGTS